MGKLLAERLRAFSRSRWLVLVAAVWVQSMAGVGYLFGAISPALKAALGYDQRQLAALAVAKNLGGYVGVVAGTLSAALPAWAMLLMGAAQNLLGYGWVWLAVTRRVPVPPLWAVRSQSSDHSSFFFSFSTFPITMFPFHFPFRNTAIVALVGCLVWSRSPVLYQR